MHAYMCVSINVCMNQCVILCMYVRILYMYEYMCVYIHLFIQAIYIAPLQAHYFSEALPMQHGYCVGVSRRSVTGNCE